MCVEAWLAAMMWQTGNGGKRKKKTSCMQGVPNSEIGWQQNRQGWINFMRQQENLFALPLAHCIEMGKLVFVTFANLNLIKPLSVLFICLFVYLFIYLFVIYSFQKHQAVPCLKGTFQSRFLIRLKRTSPSTCKEPSVTVASQYMRFNKIITQWPIVTEAVIQRVTMETTIKTGHISIAREIFQSLILSYQQGWWKVSPQGWRRICLQSPVAHPCLRFRWRLLCRTTICSRLPWGSTLATTLF